MTAIGNAAELNEAFRELAGEDLDRIAGGTWGEFIHSIARTAAQDHSLGYYYQAAGDCRLCQG
jgi:hypothetical protein